MAPASWHSRRRFFVALGIMGLMLVMGVGAAGLVQEDPSSLPTTFGVPAPQPGDRAEYTYALVDVSGAKPTLLGEELPIMAFEFAAGAALLTAERNPIEAAVRVDSWLGWNQIDDWDTMTSHWEAGAMKITQFGTAAGHHAGFDASAEMHLARQDIDPTGLGLATESAEGAIDLRMLRFPDLDAGQVPFGTLLPCGAVHALQGGPQPLDKPIVLTAGCFPATFPIDARNPEKQQGSPDTEAWNAFLSAMLLPFEPVAWQDLPQGPALVFRSTAESGAQAVLWLNEDIPFPVQMAVPANGTDVFHIMRLSSFTTGPVSASPLAMTAAPVAQLSPMRPWGPDDAGVDVRFPAAQAWVEAMADEEVVALFESHPGYVLHGVTGDAWDQAWGDVVRWDFHFQDPDGSLFGFTVTSNRDEPQGTVPAVATPVIRSPLTPSVEIRVDDARGSRAFIAPHLIHASAPTVLSTLATLRAVDATALDKVVWGAELKCQDEPLRADEDCEMYGYSTSVTNVRRVVEPDVDPSGPAVGTTSETSAAGLHVDPWGWLERFDRSAVSRDWAFAPGTPQKAAPHSPAVAAPVQAWAPSPAAMIAGAGFIGILAAALYYFAPASLGLFSRIQENKILDHPSRRLLHDAVHAQPGVHHQELARTLGKGRGGAEHHLNKLTAAGIITATEGPGYTCYFPRRTDRRVIAAGPALRSETARNILATLRDQPGSHGGHVAQHLGINRATVSHHMQRMETAGLIETRRDGRAIRAYPTAVAEMVA